jgi:hypothetical protein
MFIVELELSVEFNDAPLRVLCAFSELSNPLMYLITHPATITINNNIIILVISIFLYYLTLAIK